MPSDRRLHPLSILFSLGREVRGIALPAILVLFTADRAGWDWQVWTLPLAIPYAIVAVARCVSFRYRYEANEMVIRTGLVFRNERHVPYARIQNLDARQNVLHRLFGVVEVRVETGGGEEPEARMSVLPAAAFEEMRRRVFGERGPAEAAEAPVDSAGSTSPAAPGRTLLHLPPRELMLCGLIENRGFVIVAAAFGLVWELGLLDGFVDEVLGERVSGRGVVRQLLKALFGRGGLPLDRIALTLAAFAGLLLVTRLISMAWAPVRLHDFRLTREGGDLRTELGLLTRITATVPRRRIQTLTILEGPLHRLFGRASVRVETAAAGRTQREWLAPIVRRGELPGLLREVLPEADLAAVAWQPAHPRALGRELRGSMFFAFAISLPLVALSRGWAFALLAVLLVWALLHARLSVAHLGWAVTEGAVLFRSGWLWKEVSVARFAKIQAVAIHESPFDRRAAMARVRVDTAGAGVFSHRVDIPYLPRETALGLYDLLAAQAASTTFRW